MKITLRRIIWSVGDETSGETKRGRKARKKIESLRLRMLIKKPLIIIWRIPVFEVGELKFNELVSRHMGLASYNGSAPISD